MKEITIKWCSQKYVAINSISCILAKVWFQNMYFLPPVPPPKVYKPKKICDVFQICIIYILGSAKLISMILKKNVQNFQVLEEEDNKTNLP